VTATVRRPSRSREEADADLYRAIDLAADRTSRA